MNYELKNLDFWDGEIKKASSEYLKSILPWVSNLQIKDLIKKELKQREKIPENEKSRK